MATTIEKLFKGYTIKEIEEIVIKAGSAAVKTLKRPNPVMIKALPPKEKRPWHM